MRVRYQPLALITIQQSSFVIHDLQTLSSSFTGVQPLVLEIGCGKGQFITQLAKLEPKKNFIGIEQQSSVLYHALSQDSLPDNLRFVHADVDELLSVLSEPVEHIYLLFSDPWPKARHEKRRLTHVKRLRQYAALSSQLTIRTDNLALYEYTLESIKQSPFQITQHGILPAMESLIQTEFEIKYRKLGKPIYHIEANR